MQIVNDELILYNWKLTEINFRSLTSSKHSTKKTFRIEKFLYSPFVNRILTWPLVSKSVLPLTLNFFLYFVIRSSHKYSDQTDVYTHKRRQLVILWNIGDHWQQEVTNNKKKLSNWAIYYIPPLRTVWIKPFPSPKDIWISAMWSHITNELRMKEILTSEWMGKTRRVNENFLKKKIPSNWLKILMWRQSGSQAFVK